MSNTKTEHKLAKAQTALTVTALLDFAAVTAIFTHFLDPNWMLVLEATSKFALFPLAVIASVITTGLAWYLVHTDRIQHGERHNERKSINIFIASVETVVTLTLAVAVIGTLAFHAVFAPIAPIMFAAAIGFKALAWLGASFYLLNEEINANEDGFPIKANALAATKYKFLAAGIIAGLAAVAVVYVFVLNTPSMAMLGLAAGVAGGLFALLGLIHNAANVKLTLPTGNVQENDTSDNSLGWS